MNLWQRIALAVVFVVILSGLGKGLAASMIAARGDEFSGRTNLAYSTRYYYRALDLDPANVTANVGLVRTLYLMHTQSSMADGIAVASRFLSLHRNRDHVYYHVLEKRGYMELLTSRYADAERDFEMASVDQRSAVDADLAARSAQRLGDLAGMRRNFVRALELDPREAPSPAELARLGVRR
jgi:tetratricopeptide (TPR) repeat protein